jgi:hypothetical protein
MYGATHFQIARLIRIVCLLGMGASICGQAEAVINGEQLDRKVYMRQSMTHTE